jgi:hypothetical protein
MHATSASRCGTPRKGLPNRTLFLSDIRRATPGCRADDDCGTRQTGIEVHRDGVHPTAGGLRLPITHGDPFDVVVRHVRWPAFLGDRDRVSHKSHHVREAA